MITRMDHDLKRYPRLLAKLLTGTPLPASCSVQGQITVWTPGLVGNQALHLMQAQNYQLLRPKLLLSSHGQSSLHQVWDCTPSCAQDQGQHFLCTAGTLTFQEQEKLGWMVDMIARSSAQAQVIITTYSGHTNVPACRITLTTC